MPVRLLLLSVLLCAAVPIAHAQSVSNDTEELRFADDDLNPLSEELRMRSLLSIPLDAVVDPVSGTLGYNPFETRFRRRGLPDSYRSLSVGGIDLARVFHGQYYGVLSAMGWRFQATARPCGDIAASHSVGDAAAIVEYDLRPSSMPEASGISYALSDKDFRNRIRVYSTGGGKSLAYHVGLSRTWGRDAHVGGVFTDAASLCAGVEKKFKKFDISLLAGIAPAQRGERSYSVEEAFSLAGDNLYNPSWGYQNGKERNSRVREEMTPFAILSARTKLDEGLYFNTSLSVILESASRSALGWYDARNPRPDYYLSLPSAFDDLVRREQITRLWRDGDTRVTQIDWRRLYAAGEGDPAEYFVERRHENTRSIQWYASLEYAIAPGVDLNTGVRLRSDRGDYYKTMADLLGGAPRSDIDPYLDSGNGLYDLSLNDLRSPGRNVNTGDRFGYDYILRSTGGHVYGILDITRGKFSSNIALEAGWTEVSREGLYEKAIYPGRESYGRSDKIRFMPYTLGTSVQRALGGNSHISLSAMVGNILPSLDGVFLEPEYRNTPLPEAGNVHIQSLDLTFRRRTSRLDLSASLYYTATQNETKAYNHYNDLLEAYTFVAVEGINKRYYGVELGVNYDISRLFSVSGVAALSRNQYSSDPLMRFNPSKTGYPDLGLSSNVHWKGLYLGNSPQIVAVAALSLHTRKMFNAKLSANYTGQNYIDINPIFRSDAWDYLYASSKTSVPAQERYDDAVTLSAEISKTFKIRKRYYLSAGVRVDNLLDNTSIVYSGYESSRRTVTEQKDGVVLTPHTSRYLYGYGRTFMLNISFKM